MITSGTRQAPAYPTRVALLDRLGSTAHDADDGYVAAGERTGSGVLVRHAALVAAIPLAEHPLLTSHRDELAGHARSLLAAGTHRYRRDRVLKAMKEWGHVISGPSSAAWRTRTTS